MQKHGMLPSGMYLVHSGGSLQFLRLSKGRNDEIISVSSRDIFTSLCYYLFFSISWISQNTLKVKGEVSRLFRGETELSFYCLCIRQWTCLTSLNTLASFPAYQCLLDLILPDSDIQRKVIHSQWACQSFPEDVCNLNVILSGWCVLGGEYPELTEGNFPFVWHLWYIH